MRENTNSVDRAIHEEVTLAPYEASWQSAFVAERERLLTLFPSQFLSVEHFGSTAVPGMVAKPIIDILAGVESMAVADELFDQLLLNGYTTSREFNAMLPDRRWFMRVARGRRTHHLHVVKLGGVQWRERLRFRDALRESVTLAQQYSELKHRLAQQHRRDREAYTNAKTEFVAAVVGVA